MCLSYYLMKRLTKSQPTALLLSESSQFLACALEISGPFEAFSNKYSFHRQVLRYMISTFLSRPHGFRLLTVS